MGRNSSEADGISDCPRTVPASLIGVIGGVRSVHLRPLDRFESVPVRGSETATACCTFSPDGRSLAFSTADAILKRVSLADGLVTTVATNVEFRGADWGSDNAIVFVRSGELWKVDLSGGDARQLTMTGPDGAVRRNMWPTVLPGAEAVLFASAEPNEDAFRIESLVLATGERRTVVEAGTFPQLTPTGHLLFYRDDELLAAPFDEETRSVSGPTVSILEDLPATGLAGVPLVAVSRTGLLVYAPTVSASQLVWVSRDGAEQALADTPRNYGNPRLDPEGRWVLVQANDLWVHDLERSTFTLLTAADVTYGAFPVLTPDGTQVVFRTLAGLSRQATEGSGRGEQIAGTGFEDFPATISPDGAQLLFVRLSSETSGDIYIASLTGNAEVRPLLATPAYEGSAKLSPDGRWLAYSSNDSGRMEVYLRPFPAPDRRWQVSTEGGTQPIWNPDGTELFYRNANRMMVVSVAIGDEPTLSDPVLLFDQQYAYGSGLTIPNYDISADGQRFVMVKEESNASRLNIVQNWFQELTERVPVP